MVSSFLLSGFIKCKRHFEFVHDQLSCTIIDLNGETENNEDLCQPSVHNGNYVYDHVANLSLIS